MGTSALHPLSPLRAPRQGTCNGRRVLLFALSLLTPHCSLHRPTALAHCRVCEHSYVMMYVAHTTLAWLETWRRASKYCWIFGRHCISLPSSSAWTCGRVVKALDSGSSHESGKGSNPFGFSKNNSFRVTSTMVSMARCQRVDRSSILR
jgi:hypothetical protein